MPSVAVYDINGTEVDTFELSDAVFGKSTKESQLSEPEIQQRRQRLFYEAVRYQMAKRRTGNHAVKSRSLISGGGRKPFRQKGTGRARAGTTRAPHWRGGGVVHGPRVRSHDLQMNKKTRKAFDPKIGVGKFCAERAEHHGLIIRAIGDTISFCPPLIIKENEIALMISLFKKALDDTLSMTSES